jgi:hypothetical protein
MKYSEKWLFNLPVESDRDKPHSILSLVGWRAGLGPAADIAYNRKAHQAWKHHTDGFYTNDLAEVTQAEMNPPMGQIIRAWSK